MQKYALLFPGQGSQYIGMGKMLYEQYYEARQVYQEANDILGFDIAKLCFEGTWLELNKVENTLPAILTTGYAAFLIFMKEIGEKPQASAGHSLGEYTALVCSGAMSFADALRIVRLRSKLAAQVSYNCKGAMTVVNEIDRVSVEEACAQVSSIDNRVSVACYNSPNQHVISGHQQAVSSVEDILTAKNAQITPLLMSPAFHCLLLEQVMEKLKEELAKISFHPFMWPVFSNVSGVQYYSKKDILPNLSMQVIKPVRWKEMLNNIAQQNISMFIEIGPTSTLANLTIQNLEHAKVYSLSQVLDNQKLVRHSQTESDIKGKEKRSYLITVVTKCIAAAVSTRNNNENSDEYEKGVVLLFKEIEKMQWKLMEDNQKPNEDQIHKALNMLKSVLITKRIPLEKQRAIFKRIFQETGSYHLLKEFQEELNIRE